MVPESGLFCWNIIIWLCLLIQFAFCREPLQSALGGCCGIRRLRRKGWIWAKQVIVFFWHCWCVSLCFLSKLQLLQSGRSRMDYVQRLSILVLCFGNVFELSKTNYLSKSVALLRPELTNSFQDRAKALTFVMCLEALEALTSDLATGWGTSYDVAANLL